MCTVKVQLELAAEDVEIWLVEGDVSCKRVSEGGEFLGVCVCRFRLIRV